jgi:hypothetical protein
MYSEWEGRRKQAKLPVRRSNAPKTNSKLLLPEYWRQHALKRETMQHGKPALVNGGDQPETREGQSGPGQVAERLVVPVKSGNADGGKEPQFLSNVERSESRTGD